MAKRPELHELAEGDFEFETSEDRDALLSAVDNMEFDGAGRLVNLGDVRASYKARIVEIPTEDGPPKQFKKDYLSPFVDEYLAILFPNSLHDTSNGEGREAA